MAETRHVYIAAAKSFYKNSTNYLRILSWAPPMRTDITSWVPKFERGSTSRVKSHLGLKGFSAGQRQEFGHAMLRVKYGVDLLGLTGFYCDTISKAEPFALQQTSTTSSYTASEHAGLYAWYQKCLVSTTLLLSGSEDEELYSVARTLVYDRRLRSTRGHRTRFEPDDIAIARGCLINRSAPKTYLPEPSYVMSLASSAVGRAFFTTRTGRIGLGPATIEEGDDVLILHGGEVPKVARSRSFKRDVWEYIGECYVDGIMYGKANRTYKHSKAPDQTFMFD